MTITILLADDHAIVRDGLRALLESQSDLQVVGDAADGRAAVRQAFKLRPAVAILDIAMPTLSGIDAAQEILSHRPATKIIILSMHDSVEYIERALQAGVHGYLLKESAGIEVVQAVRAVYAGQRYLSQKIVERQLDYSVEPEAAEPLARLSSREREILKLVVEGKSSIEIAGLLHLSPKTVDTYRSRLMTKLEIKDIPGLVKFALQQGLISLE